MVGCVCYGGGLDGGSGVRRRRRRGQRRRLRRWEEIGLAAVLGCYMRMRWDGVVGEVRRLETVDVRNSQGVQGKCLEERPRQLAGGGEGMVLEKRQHRREILVERQSWAWRVLGSAGASPPSTSMSVLGHYLENDGRK